MLTLDYQPVSHKVPIWWIQVFLTVMPWLMAIASYAVSTVSLRYFQAKSGSIVLHGTSTERVARLAVETIPTGIGILGVLSPMAIAVTLAIVDRKHSTMIGMILCTLSAIMAFSLVVVPGLALNSYEGFP